jgi:hypothetical protein
MASSDFVVGKMVFGRLEIVGISSHGGILVL